MWKITVGENEMDYRAGDGFFVKAGEKVVSVEGTGVIIVTKVWDIVYLIKNLYYRFVLCSTIKI